MNHIFYKVGARYLRIVILEEIDGDAFPGTGRKYNNGRLISDN
jgi:hypothetical protein